MTFPAIHASEMIPTQRHRSSICADRLGAPNESMPHQTNRWLGAEIPNRRTKTEEFFPAIHQGIEKSFSSLITSHRIRLDGFTVWPSVLPGLPGSPTAGPCFRKHPPRWPRCRARRANGTARGGLARGATFTSGRWGPKGPTWSRVLPLTAVHRTPCLPCWPK